jgi:hypothetical protein
VLIFAPVMVVAWVAGTFLLVYFWPHLVNNVYKKAILNEVRPEKSGKTSLISGRGMWSVIALDSDWLAKVPITA